MADIVDNRGFVVGDKPYCAWYAKGTTEAFLKGIDTEYFQYLAETHAPNLDGEHKERAAIALRAAYHQGLETLFMLLLATLQAPNCIAGWLLKCEPRHLQKFVKGISSGELPFIWKWKLEKASWDGISELINGTVFGGRDDCMVMREGFARVWETLASDYTEQYFICEYNSFKHGFRASIGPGPTLSFHSPSPDQSNENQAVVLSSEYGSWFNIARALEGVKQGSHLDHHFVLEHCHVNVDPKMTAAALCMISMSIKNIVAFMKSINGFPSAEIQFVRPVNEEAFGSFLKSPEKSGLKYVAMCLNVKKETVSLTKEQILERLAKLKEKNDLAHLGLLLMEKEDRSPLL
jgi:hypothetical protein